MHCTNHAAGCLCGGETLSHLTKPRVKAAGSPHSMWRSASGGTKCATASLGWPSDNQRQTLALDAKVAEAPGGVGRCFSGTELGSWADTGDACARRVSARCPAQGRE